MVVWKGKEVSDRIKIRIEEGMKKLNGYIPTLAIVRVGEKPDDISYERGARKKAESMGLLVRSFAFPETITEEQFLDEFQSINEDERIDGILLLKPLPRHISEKKIEQILNPLKDLDGITPANIAGVFAGETSAFAPCTAQAVMEVLDFYGEAVEGKRAVVIGRSMVVGRPLAMLLLRKNATVTICHTKTKDLEKVCKEADILVAAAGKAKMVDDRFVREGAVVLDVGIHVDEDGKLCGDVDFESVSSRASAITPVPGGVGTVTTAVLCLHLVQAALRKGDEKWETF